MRRPLEAPVKLIALPLLLAAASAGAQSPSIVYAKPVGVVPGAIICPDYNTLTTVFDLFNDAWEDHAASAMTAGKSELVNGKALDYPIVSEYGCAFAKPGTKMEATDSGIGAPMVSYVREDGRKVKGITLPGMVSAENVTQKQPEMLAEPDAGQADKRPVAAIPAPKANATALAADHVPGAVACDDTEGIKHVIRMFKRKESGAFGHGCNIIPPGTRVIVSVEDPERRLVKIDADLATGHYSGWTLPEMVQMDGSEGPHEKLSSKVKRGIRSSLAGWR